MCLRGKPLGQAGWPRPLNIDPRSCGREVDRQWTTCALTRIMIKPLTETSSLARLMTDAGTAHRLSDALMEVFDPGETAIATFEEAGAWAVEIYFERPPDHDALRALLRDIAGEAVSERVTFTSVAAR